MGKPVEVRVLSRALPCLEKLIRRAWIIAYFEEAFLLAAQRAFISSESFRRPAGVSEPLFLLVVDFVPPAFLLAAQRAFINCDSFRRPAAVSWPFFLGAVAVCFGAVAVCLGAVAVVVPLCLAQRALAAAASFARVVGEKKRPASGRAAVVLGDAPPRIEERRFSRLSICRRIEIASSRALTDVSMGW
jgi:hypothetical protein